MRGGMMFNQKDIVLIPFPYSDLTGSKKRPALIVSNEKINKTQDRICCLVTTNQHKNDLKIENKLKTLKKDFVTEALGVLGFWPRGRVIPNPDVVLEEVTERSLSSVRVGKRVLE